MEPVERAGYVSDDRGRHVQIKSGGCQLGMAEQELDGADVGAGFEEMGGEAVAQRVQGAGFFRSAACRAAQQAICSRLVVTG